MASLVAQMVKNLPAMQETQVQSLGWEDPLKKEMATHSSILAWRIPWTEEAGGYSPRGCKESDTTELEATNTHIHTHTHTELTTQLNIYAFVAPEELVFPAVEMCGPIAFNSQHSPGIHA